MQVARRKMPAPFDISPLKNMADVAYKRIDEQTRETSLLGKKRCNCQRDRLDQQHGSHHRRIGYARLARNLENARGGCVSPLR